MAVDNFVEIHPSPSAEARKIKSLPGRAGKSPRCEHEQNQALTSATGFIANAHRAWDLLPGFCA
jgi:hypothetical protein